MTGMPERLELTTLLAATARGDRTAFQKLYERTAPRLLGVCIRLLGDRHQAEDALQDAYIRIWHNAGEYHEERGTPLTWMMTIVRYLSLDQLRARKRHAAEDDIPDEQTAGPETLSVRFDELARLGHCLEHLSEDQRDSVLQVYYRGLTHDELSRHLDTPLGTVKSWVRRGIQSLKRCLQP